MSTAVIPRLSIVVPFYDVERYFGPCLDSLARQTFRDFEVVLVDDGSRDGSAAIAREWCERDSRFRLISQENRGMGPARNAGIELARGEYLTFVDSDDLVPRHAYELLVGSLDRTSSSLAGGNARRFNNTSGVRQSYVHRISYGADRPATHVTEWPELAIDRMVWNKVYRRTFWDQFRYEFPAMRYEDWPVALKAHLDAVTVDCVAAPTYYWRERESGESVTQLKFQFGNLEDRVRSAGMILDMVDRRAPELRWKVHRHLTLIDLATVVQAFGSAPEHELEAVLALGRRLTGRLDPEAFVGASAIERLEYHGLQSGDVELLQRIARYRAGGGRPSAAPAERHPVLPWRYRARGLPETPGTPPDVHRLSRGDLELRAAATNLIWDHDALLVSGTAVIDHLPPGADDTLRIALLAGLRETPLTVDRHPVRGSGGEERLIGFTARVPRELLAAMPAKREAVRLIATLRSGSVRRRSLLQMNMQYPVGDRIGDAWFQPVKASDGRLLIRRMRGETELTAAEADGGDLVLTGQLPPGGTATELVLSRAARELRAPLETGPDNLFTVRIPVAEVVDATSPDDPFLGRTNLIPKIGDALILITGLPGAVSVQQGDRLLTVARSPGQYLNLVEMPARVTAARVHVDGWSVTVEGPRWAGVDYERIVWRRFLPNSDDPVDAICRITLDGDRWQAQIGLDDLGPAEDADWTLFAAGDGLPYAIQAETFALTSLPRALDRHRLYARAGTLHLEKN
ncbi:glycosyltransferase [Actinoplanes sp. NPDC026670]|uniref:glycosyltransferase n=1 Tax=Actinoplanes sp. NPDC026670 TaxID=3154700 RepID=UPI0033DC124E